MMCMRCGEKAQRTYEGIEDDHYRCERCGFEFGVDWSRGPPERPCWPPSDEEREAFRGTATLGDEAIATTPNRKWWQFWK
jgi:hypothetical protein